MYSNRLKTLTTPLVLCLLAVLSFKNVKSQTTVSITQDTASTCNGTLFDSGGQGATGYQDNEYYVLTICPDNPNDVITLNWLNFALSTTNTAPNPQNNADYLTIYDGNSTAATTLGTYTGTSLQGLIVTGTSLNTSGCLTLEFESNDQGVGAFAASISCSTPCQRPTVVMDAPTVGQNPQLICQGETVAFDGSNSFASPGFNIVSYVWDFGDGTVDTTTTGTTNHSFDAGSGEYNVNLYVVDDNDCINSNLETIKVLVGTTPTFNGLSADTLLCLGESVCLDGAYQTVQYTGQPQNTLTGQVYLPDDVGSCFTADINFFSFVPGAVLTNINQLNDICIDMEHSYMGDLVGTIYCPNGQNVILHQQNGGGTFLGDPIDVDDSLQPGTCMQYCFSPTATNGTWVDNAQFGATPNTIPSVNNPGQELLAPGTYESLNPLSGLVGCPLNGTWSIEFCDLWGSDDGFVCDWNIDLDSSLYAPITEFEPTIGAQCDSSYWTSTGPASTIITSTSGNCDQICLTPTANGTYDYTYTVVDNFGCTYDTVVQVTVNPGPTVNAGPDATLCTNNPYDLNAVPLGGILPDPLCDYSIIMSDGAGDGWNGFSLDIVVDGINVGNFTLNTGMNGTETFPVPDGVSISISSNSGYWDSEVSYQIVDCQGNVVFQDGPNFTGANPVIGPNVWIGTSVNPNPPNYNFSWTPPTGLSDPNIQNPIATISSPQTYVVEVWETNHELCSSFDTILLNISAAFNAGDDSTASFCGLDTTMNLIDQLGGTPDVGGAWISPAGDTLPDVFNPSVTNSGTFTYIVGGIGCMDTAVFTATIADPIVLNLSSDTIICENGTASININPTGGLGGPYTQNWTPNTITNAPFVYNAGGDTCFSVFVVDAFGCVSDPDTTCVTVNPPLSLSLILPDTVCIGETTTSTANATGGNGGPYTYNWTNQGVSVGTLPAIDNSAPTTTTLCVTIDDGCETTPVDSCIVFEVHPTPEPSFTVDATDGCYPITVNFTNTTDSAMVQSASWDFGNGDASSNTWTASSTYTTDDCYDVRLSIVSPEGCISDTLMEDLICPFGYPIADFSMTPNPTNILETNIYFTNQSTGAVSYQWSFDDNASPSTSTEVDPNSEFPNQEPGTYDITLIATNADGCTDDTTYTLVINGTFALFTPNAFTPNGDGLNETFFAQGVAIDPTDYEMLLFDRDGHILFETTDINTAWTGVQTDGTEAPIGVYVWRINARDIYTGEFHEYFGHVTLVR